MGALDTIEFKKIIKLLRANGYYQRNQTGSHINYKKDGYPHIITIPKPAGKEIKLYSVKEIMRRLNLNREDFLEELKKY